TVRAKIAETQPMVKSATASSSYKPATLENGVTVLVPQFVSEGEQIIVDPSENRYIERAKGRPARISSATHAAGAWPAYPARPPGPVNGAPPGTRSAPPRPSIAAPRAAST